MSSGLNDVSVSTVVAVVGDASKSFVTSVTRLGNLLDFGQLFNAFGNN